MTQHERTFKAFVNLGNFLNSFCESIDQDKIHNVSENKWFSLFKDSIENAQHYN